MIVEMGVCAGIVTYNPDLTRLKLVLKSVRGQFSCIWIVDNGSNNYEEIATLIAGCNDVELVALGNNLGIAAALNVICKKALDAGYDHVLTLDQDTVIEDGMADSLESHIGEKVAVVCPRVLYEGNEAFCKSSNDDVEQIAWAITSGSLTSLEAWKSVGGFDERMFIDGVDKDFCLRLGESGWSVIRVNNVTIHHRLGQLLCRRVFGKTLYITNHSAMRCYYRSRNHVYLYRKDVIGLFDMLLYSINLPIKVLFFEEDKTAKLEAIYQGFRAGFAMDISTRMMNGISPDDTLCDDLSLGEQGSFSR